MEKREERRELGYRCIKAFLVSQKGGIVYCVSKKKTKYVALPEPVRSTACICDQPMKSQNSSSMPTNERHGLVEPLLHADFNAEKLQPGQDPLAADGAVLNLRCALFARQDVATFVEGNIDLCEIPLA